MVRTMSPIESVRKQDPVYLDAKRILDINYVEGGTWGKELNQAVIDYDANPTAETYEALTRREMLLGSRTGKISQTLKQGGETF